jgi:beta-glucanase (GH16 family)
MKPLIALLGLLSCAFPASAQWKLHWSEEFNLPKGAPPDPATWVFDLGGGGWGNRELEIYTNSDRNVFHDGDGHLVIRAAKEDDGRITSARLKTQGKVEFLYGKIEVRLKVPVGQGIWPAFWMLGDNFTTARWPGAGEIDIMEHIGKEPATVHGTLHGPGYSGGKGVTSQTSLPAGRLSDDFHVFGAIWEKDSIEFTLDGVVYSKMDPSKLPEGTKWVFDHPFFMLLNLAVGGQWPGNPDETTTFPQQLTVDWIRIWKRSE